MTDSTDRLIESLGEDLRPVRPLPRLRTAFAIVLTAWATFLGVVVVGFDGEITTASLLGDRVYLASFVGLAVAALGATASALASGVPGRERVEFVGMALSAVGLIAGAVACVIGMQALGFDAGASPAGVDAMCFERAAMFSLLPAGVVLSFLVRGWIAHPFRAALVALVASGALGTMIVHLSCDYVAPRHVIVSHMSVPIVLALLGLYPIAVILRRLRG